MKLILASNNTHKRLEFARLLGNSGAEVTGAESVGGMPEVDETGSTFQENARLKAEALRPVLPEGAWGLADDSGLEVDALDGKPGVRSARFAGPAATDAANLWKLLACLRTVPAEKRTARFVCVLCLLDRHGKASFFKGTCEGNILDAPMGTEGFGYDPVFQPTGHTASFASLGASVKDRVSHRAQAVAKLHTAITSGKIVPV